MPRATMRSIDASRAADMPTDFGVLTGNPSDAASATHAPRRRSTTRQLPANGEAVAHDRGYYKIQPGVQTDSGQINNEKRVMAAWCRL